MKAADGSRRWLSVNAAPLTTSNGEIERVIAAITDITEKNDGETLIDGAGHR
ncbi:MAG: PAS domain S-box protein [Haloarcula sp.]